MPQSRVIIIPNPVVPRVTDANNINAKVISWGEKSFDL